VKERRKPGPVRQSTETGGGLALEIHHLERGGGSSGQLVDGRRLGSQGGGALDGAPRRGGPGGRAAGGDIRDSFATGGVRGRPAHLVRGRQRRGSRAVPSRARRYRSPPGFRDGSTAASAEACAEQSTEAGLASSNAILPGCVRRGLLRRMVTNHESGADTPGIGRSTAGARDVGRLQKSVRSTFSVHGAAPRGVGSNGVA
jgi:hypothetical protein